MNRYSATKFIITQMLKGDEATARLRWKMLFVNSMVGLIFIVILSTHPFYRPSEWTGRSDQMDVDPAPEQ